MFLLSWRMWKSEVRNWDNASLYEVNNDETLSLTPHSPRQLLFARYIMLQTLLLRRPRMIICPQSRPKPRPKDAKQILCPPTRIASTGFTTNFRLHDNPFQGLLQDRCHRRVDRPTRYYARVGSKLTHCPFHYP